MGASDSRDADDGYWPQRTGGAYGNGYGDGYYNPQAAGMNYGYDPNFYNAPPAGVSYAQGPGMGYGDGYMYGGRGQGRPGDTYGTTPREVGCCGSKDKRPRTRSIQPQPPQGVTMPPPVPGPPGQWRWVQDEPDISYMNMAQPVGGSYTAMPPSAVTIGGSYTPMPPSAVTLGGSYAPMPQSAVTLGASFAPMPASGITRAASYVAMPPALTPRGSYAPVPAGSVQVAVAPPVTGGNVTVLGPMLGASPRFPVAAPVMGAGRVEVLPPIVTGYQPEGPPIQKTVNEPVEPVATSYGRGEARSTGGSQYEPPSMSEVGHPPVAPVSPVDNYDDQLADEARRHRRRSRRLSGLPPEDEDELQQLRQEQPKPQSQMPEEDRNDRRSSAPAAFNPYEDQSLAAVEARSAILQDSAFTPPNPGQFVPNGDSRFTEPRASSATPGDIGAWPSLGYVDPRGSMTYSQDPRGSMTYSQDPRGSMAYSQAGSMAAPYLPPGSMVGRPSTTTISPVVTPLGGNQGTDSSGTNSWGMGGAPIVTPMGGSGGVNSFGVGGSLNFGVAPGTTPTGYVQVPVLGTMNTGVLSMPTSTVLPTSTVRSISPLRNSIANPYDAAGGGSLSAIPGPPAYPGELGGSRRGTVPSGFAYGSSNYGSLVA